MYYDFSKYRILIADDEDANYVLTKRLLSETKVKTDWAQNGLHAVEMASRTHYDLIIMDVKMPEMDGIQATRLIKQQFAKLPILVHTAYSMPEVRERALNAGCNEFIVKPISSVDFLLLVNSYLVK